MSLLKSIGLNRRLLYASMSIALLVPAAQADKMVSDLVPDIWVEDERLVAGSQKSYIANLYGGSAEIQVMLLNNGTATTFDIEQLAVNSTSISCRTPLGGEDIGTLDSNYTQVCNFDPKLTLNKKLSGGGYVTDNVQDYWSRVRFNNATNRSVKFRQKLPELPHCDINGNSATYNIHDSCTSITKDESFSDNQYHKPAKNYSGQSWTPLVVKGQNYRVTLDVRQGNVEVKNGMKLKVSGSAPAVPNDEIVEGFLWDASCGFESQTTLTPGVYSCEFIATDHGFLHIPIKRVGSGSRRVITTVEVL